MDCLSCKMFHQHKNSLNVGRALYQIFRMSDRACVRQSVHWVVSNIILKEINSSVYILWIVNGLDASYPVHKC